MCTLILLHRPAQAGLADGWPVLLAANRDEMLDRPWSRPAAHWPDQPGVVGGRDTLAGGTWLAVNRAGVVACVLNRAGSLGPEAGRLSRGVLPLLALRHGSAAAAAAAIAALDGGAYRAFNVVVADEAAAYFLRGTGRGAIAVSTLAPGLHMVAAGDPDDTGNPRVARHLPAFAGAELPAPPDWKAWPSLLANADGPFAAALNVPPTQGFGTSSSALIALGPAGRHFLFAAGPPGAAPFLPVDAPAGGAAP